VTKDKRQEAPEAMHVAPLLLLLSSLFFYVAPWFVIDTYGISHVMAMVIDVYDISFITRP
jgi:hypothetical protein